MKWQKAPCLRWSPSTRRAWVEIFLISLFSAILSPSPSTRRAWVEIQPFIFAILCSKSPSTRRAWVEILLHTQSLHLPMSPSTRMAWVEIMYKRLLQSRCRVALYAEGVGRNWKLRRKLQGWMVALHVRAWVEIYKSLQNEIKQTESPSM